MVIQLHDFLGCVCILSILQNSIIHKLLLPAIRMDYLFILLNLFHVVTAIINHIQNIFNVLMQGTQPGLHPQLTLPTENMDLPRILPDIRQLTIVLCFSSGITSFPLDLLLKSQLCTTLSWNCLTRDQKEQSFGK